MKKMNLQWCYSIIVSALLLLFNSGCSPDDPIEPGFITDLDGNIYHPVTICDQVWMVENLNVAKYRNGDPIPKVTDDATWCALTTGAYCYYNNDSTAYAAIYGKLYNWYAVIDPRGLAPEGFHIPTDMEWAVLDTCLGGEYVAGGAMKETGTTHWVSPNNEATNLSGFTGLPGGSRDDCGRWGLFFDLGSYGSWWSTTEDDTGGAWYRRLGYWDDNFIRNNYGVKSRGYSVRCLKD